jgi:hypothetical protein
VTNGGLPFNAITKNNNQRPYIPYKQVTVAAPGNTGGAGVAQARGKIDRVPGAGASLESE